MDDALTNSQRSLSNQNWIESPSDYPEDSLDLLCRRLNVSRALGRILAARDLLDADAAERFLHPGEHQLHSPHLMRGMREAVERIHEALVNYQKILIFGDYDVDGTASTSILFNYLKRLGARVQYYIPHRLEDGYGFSPVTLAKFKGWGIDLLITADHGSTAVDGALALEKEGIDLIITDHHRLGRVRPRCVALVNPHQEGCAYPFKELAAAGVAFKVVCALDDFLSEDNYWDTHGICRTAPNYYLDLAALATVADMTPLIGENRILVSLGLELINSRPRPGLSGLIKECNVRGAVSPSVISFKLAPKINALGRIGDPRMGVRLLLSHSFTESRKLARLLVGINQERRRIEQEVLAMATRQMDAAGDVPAYVLVGGDWHPGVIGSIATRVAFQTRKPTVVLTCHHSTQVVGSARSWNGCNMLNLLAACEPLLNRFGGHPSAAGLSLSPANLEAFTLRFHEAVRHATELGSGCGANDLEIDTWVTPDMLEGRFFEEVAQLSPFGYCNPEPVVAMRGMTVANHSWFQNRHLKFSLFCPNGREHQANAWDHPDWDLAGSHTYDVAFVPQTYEGPGGARSQLKVVDMIRHG
jgi:single-stranded-DNA-specific exonuclease